MKTKSFIISKWQVLKAYELVKANAGAAGVDKQSLSDFERNLKSNLYKLWNRLSSGSYFPPPVKAVAIPKKAGGESHRWWSNWSLSLKLNHYSYRTRMATGQISRLWMQLV
jgi:retron-type reverse transcriptase